MMEEINLFEKENENKKEEKNSNKISKKIEKNLDNLIAQLFILRKIRNENNFPVFENFEKISEKRENEQNKLFEQQEARKYSNRKLKNYFKKPFSSYSNFEKNRKEWEFYENKKFELN